MAVMEDFWDKGDNPTRQQRIWGDLFVAIWNVVDSYGAGGGKTWFWRRVVWFIEDQDPWVKTTDSP